MQAQFSVLLCFHILKGEHVIPTVIICEHFGYNLVFFYFTKGCSVNEFHLGGIDFMLLSGSSKTLGQASGVTEM